METDHTAVCELLVGLGDVNVVGIDDAADEPIRIHVETRRLWPGCKRCEASAVVKDRPRVELVDLPAFGRPARLVWRKHRWACPDPSCATGTWTEQEPRIAAARLALTDRAGRWVTFQVGKHGRTVNEVAQDLGCDWHTVNDAVIAYGTALIDDDDRIGDVEALGLDETLFCRQGRWRTQAWSTQIVDVSKGRLLDVVEGRNAARPAAWLAARGEEWCSQIRWATLDLSGPYRSVFDTMLPDAVQVADPFHVIKLANTKVDETRRRVQNETMGHRGRKTDPLYRIRRLLTKADERLTDKGRTKLVGLLAASDPHGEVKTAWHAKEVVRQIYSHTGPNLAVEHVEAVGRDLQDVSCLPEVRSLGRTIIRWKDQIAAWHQAHVSNGPTEAANNLIKRIKRVAFGLRRYRNYRTRTLLYAGQPDWNLLATITPRRVRRAGYRCPSFASCENQGRRPWRGGVIGGVLRRERRKRPSGRLPGTSVACRQVEPGVAGGPRIGPPVDCSGGTRVDVDNDDGDRSRSADTLVDAVNGLLETSPLKALEQALVRATLDGPSVLDAMLVGEIVDDPQEMARRSPVATEVYLKSLSVTGFRGVGPLATLDIEPGPGLTLVVGRNGSGKSSFADGLELLLTGSAWRWQDKSKVWTAGWRNLHHPQKALVSAEFIVDGVPSPVVAELAWADADGLEEGIRTSQPRGQKVQPLSDLGWEEAVDTARPFLSYSELGSLLDVGPTRLYDSLSRILGLDRLVEGTENLRQQRLARNKALKTVKGSLASEVLPRLSESNDPRARRCEQALALKPWDLDVISQLVGASGTVGEPDDLSELRRLSILVSPGHRIVEDMIAELRRLETDRAALRSTDSGNAAQVSNLLSAALTHYDEHGETDCPVCGTIGIIDDQWARATREQLAALEATAQRYRSAQAELKNAMTVLRQLPTTSDISKGSISQLIDDANGALQALDAWNRAISETDPLSAADLLESTIEPALVALAAIRSAASCELEKREDEWKPVADAVRRWLHSATSAIADVDAVAHIETAEKWLRAATDEIRTHRFEPIGQQSQDIWSKLSIQSNVHISDVLLTGSATGRKVEIQIDVDGKEGVALGVMSQGELHSLVLSLYLPRARIEESPFRFVVIDDPVQAMDPSRVDGLASVLHEMATDRQVIVFTHDDRLPEAVRRLQIPARIVEVHRRPQSVVELRDSLDPVQQALADAWAVSRSSGVPNDVQRRVVAGFCRSALETASIESFRRRRLSSGKPYTDVEAEVSRATRLSHYLSLALFDDLDSGGRVLSTLKQKWGPQAADTYQACNKGVHSTYGGDLTQLVNEGRSLAERIRQL